MRPIKFMAWNGEKMFRQHEASFSIHEDVMYCLNHNENIVAESIKTGHVFMQFTGLLDKNGKEIYEGDMLGTDGDAKFPVYKTGIVVFEKGAFTLKPFYQTDERFEFRDELKIIGNIYENPELLNA